METPVEKNKSCDAETTRSTYFFIENIVLLQQIAIDIYRINKILIETKSAILAIRCPPA